jgi:hypothetical protein
MTSVREPEAWSIRDVFLLTESREGRVAIPHLQLSFLTTGIELAKSSGDVAWHGAWSTLDELSTAERSVLPDGRAGVVIVLVERGGRQHRFVLPADEPDAIEARVREEARRHRLRTHAPPTAVSPKLTVAVAVTTLVTLTVLLLSAAHVLHF